MNRIKTYDATGIAPNGKLYAGDLNLLQDTVAALSDFAQTFDSSTLRIGDTSLSISKFGAGELAISSALRVAGYLRANGGLAEANFTTTQRNALVTPPTGLVIFNTTTGRPEINTGTPAAPAWSAFGFIPTGGGGLIGNGDIAAAAGIVYSKLALALSIVNGDVANGAAIAYSKLNLVASILDADIAAGAAISPTKISSPADANKFLSGVSTWLVPGSPVNTQAVSYTLVLTDQGKIIEMNSGSANNLTVPPNSTVAFPVGTTVNVGQLGAGQTTLVPGAGVTLRAYNGNLKIAGQYGVASVIKRATDEWWVMGNLIP